MENKAHALAAGAFVLGLVAVLVALVVWLTRDETKRNVYELSTREAVSGLQPQAMVPQVMALMQVMYAPAERLRVFSIFGVLGGIFADDSELIAGNRDAVGAFLRGVVDLRFHDVIFGLHDIVVQLGVRLERHHLFTGGEQSRERFLMAAELGEAQAEVRFRGGVLWVGIDSFLQRSDVRQ